MPGSNSKTLRQERDPQIAVQELIAAWRAGALSLKDDALVNPETTLQAFHLHRVEYALIEQFKSQVDRLVRIDTREAVDVANLAVALSRLSEDVAARALGMRAKGMALHLHARYAEAVEYYEAARQLYAEADRPIEKARIERALTDALIYLGRYEEALAIAESARAVFIKHREPVLLGQLESNTGNIYHRLDRHREALTHYERSAALFAESAPEQLGKVTFNTANVYCSLDDFRQAERLYEKALAMHRANEDEPGAVQTRYSLGYLHFLRGAYHQAMRVLQETRAEALQTGDEQTAALSILDLAEIYLQMNVLDEAVRLGEQARKLFLDLGMRYEAARALMFQGLGEFRQGKFAVAEALLGTAHAEFAAEGNQVHLGLVGLYQAEAAFGQGDYVHARHLAQEAADIFSKEGLKAKTCTAQLVKLRACLASGQDVRFDCESLLQECRALDSPWLHSQAHECLGDALLAAQQLDAARAQYAEAISFIEKIRCQIRVDEFRSAFFKDQLRVYEKLIRLCLQESDPARQAEAFYYLESSKARTLVDLLFNDLTILPASPENHEGHSDLIARWQKLREELHWHYSKLNQSEAQSHSRLLMTDQHLRGDIARCERELTEITRALQATDPNFVWLEHSGGITSTELRDLLAADETVIEYYFDGEQLKLFVIDAAGLRVYNSPQTRTEISAHVQSLRFQFDKFQYGAAYLKAHGARLQSSSQQCLHELWQALLSPIAEDLTGRKLIFVPFGFLHNVPFQALYDGSQYLLEKHEIAQAPSARLLQLGSNRSTPRGADFAVFGVADASTPQIKNEIAAIQHMFAQAQCFIGKDATREALLKAAGSAGTLHIASHATFRQDNPMFSAFQLADTWLNLYDIASLKLPSTLVTLSACSTGTSRVYAGDELMGLARGFLAAGASALVVSLWAVNDPATAELMTSFYGHLKAGKPVRAALRAAALSTKQQFAHPYYWAPFILISYA